MWIWIITPIVAVISWLAAFISRGVAITLNIIDRPRGRHEHKRPVPKLGGLGIGAVIIIATVIGLYAGWFSPTIRQTQTVGFLVGVLILMVGGYLDDKYELKSWQSIWFPLLAALTIVLSGTTIRELSNPFGSHPLSLVWQTWTLSTPLSVINIIFPADVLTIAWMLAVMAATKFSDGLDGLVTGQAVIGAGLIAALTLSPVFFQPSVTVLALIVGAAFLGFLPSNVFPAKQFLGEAGSTIAGFTLGFLAVASGAKVATALMAIGLPLIDIVLVMIQRVLRGMSPFHGDRTHLHFRLTEIGWSIPKAVAFLWTISLVFGVVALGVQTRGKILLLIGLILVCLSLSILLKRRSISKYD